MQGGQEIDESPALARLSAGTERLSMMGLCVQCGGRKGCINNAKKEFQVVRLQRAAKTMQNRGFSTLQKNVLNNDSPSWAGPSVSLDRLISRWVQQAATGKGRSFGLQNAPQCGPICKRNVVGNPVFLADVRNLVPRDVVFDAESAAVLVREQLLTRLKPFACYAENGI